MSAIDRSRARYVPGVLVCGFLATLYVGTLAPGLTWAFNGADGGDLITAAATGGVPHPTGYPTYLLIASVFQRIPVGSLALRTNLLSLVAALLAAALIYAMVLRASQGVFAASVASLAFGTAPLIWSQAIITEVYTLQALLTACFLMLLLSARPRRFIEVTLGFVAGLSLGNHLMGAFLLPLLALTPESARGANAGAHEAKAESSSRITIYLQRLTGLAAGLCIFLVIPLRARAQSPVNWGNAHSPQSLLSLVSGQPYWDRLRETGAAYLIGGGQSWAGLMTEQFALPGLLLALFGLIILFQPRALHIATSWLAISSSLFAILFYSPDSYVYLVPALIAFSIWIGMGSGWVKAWASGRLAQGGGVAVLAIAGFFLCRGILAVPRMDLSEDRHAEVFGRAILAQAPDNSILLTAGDEATFVLWYFHYALQERTDVAVVSADLYLQPWYREVLRYTYAGLTVPSEPWKVALALANPGRTMCRVTSIVKSTLECGPGAADPALGTEGN